MNKYIASALLAFLWLYSGLSFALDAKLVAKGEYLARAGDCVSCHSAGGGAAFAGGRAMRTPFGTLFTPNITPDKATGLGNWSFEDFYKALHQGIGKSGQPLYPAFSYTSYTKVTREDAKAIYTYLQSVPPVVQKNRKPEFGFPYNIRTILYSWRTLYFSEGEYQENPSQSPEWNRGAYLVQGLGHCNECHTTRNALGAVNDKAPLTGGFIPVEGWYAPSLSMQAGGGLEGWSQEDVVALLKTGMSSKGGALGPMAEVVRNSTQYLTNADLKAIALYLASLPGLSLDKAQVPQRKANNYEAGKAIFAKYCDACHGEYGQGQAGIYPALAGNISVQGGEGVNAIRSVLLGGFAPTTQSNPEPYSMPPFANKLSNDDIASVVNYIRQSWGNNGSPIVAEDVTKARFQSRL